MTTTIAPALGHGTVLTQTGVGATPGFDAIDLRRADSTGIQEGVVDGTAYMVVQRAAGANLSVDIGANVGFACVQGDSVTGQALYTIAPHSAVINEVIATADATNPRIDQVILEALDTTHDASGLNIARTRVLTGTPTSGATLANRTGAAALPSNALRLADVLVPAADTTIDNTQIRDRRAFARGAYLRIFRTQNAAAGSDYATAITTYASIDGTNIKPRIECSGLPLSISVRGLALAATADDQLAMKIQSDAADLDGISDLWIQKVPATSNSLFLPPWETIPAAGSHQFDFQFRNATAARSITLFARAIAPLEIIIQEHVRQNVANNSVTSG